MGYVWVDAVIGNPFTTESLALQGGDE